MKVIYHYPRGDQSWTQESDLTGVPLENMSVMGPNGDSYYVRHTVFYPWGDTANKDGEIVLDPVTREEKLVPFIYVVLRKGEARNLRINR
jgi:hypothetical protein